MTGTGVSCFTGFVLDGSGFVAGGVLVVAAFAGGRLAFTGGAALGTGTTGRAFGTAGFFRVAAAETGFAGAGGVLGPLAVATGFRFAGGRDGGFRAVTGRMRPGFGARFTVEGTDFFAAGAAGVLAGFGFAGWAGRERADAAATGFRARTVFSGTSTAMAAAINSEEKKQERALTFTKRD